MSRLLPRLGLFALCALSLAAAAPRPLDVKSIAREEAYWPYTVALREPWQPPGAAQPIAPGLDAVLIRLEPDGTARVDFGRDGIHRVPIEKTDLLARAERIRSGEAPKLAPNFAYAITPRLLDSAADGPRGFAATAFATSRVFVCWFADPHAAGFESLLKAIPESRPGVTALLFPQGDVSDGGMREALRKLERPLPFVLDHLSEPYTATLLDPGVTFPRFLVVSGEGRWLGEGAWDASAPARVRALADAALAAPEPAHP